MKPWAGLMDGARQAALDRSQGRSPAKTALTTVGQTRQPRFSLENLTLPAIKFVQFILTGWRDTRRSTRQC